MLRLGKPRGNAIDGALLEDMARTLGEAASDRGIQGVLLASAHPKLFCPGLDLVSLSSMDRGQMERFMTLFHEVLLALFSFKKPMVAALSGHAVAGGLILAMTADWRVLARGAQVGLNEVKIGLPLPFAVACLLRGSVAPPSLAAVALLGRNFSDEEALLLGVVHELLPREGFEEGCLARLQEFVDKDPLAFSETKRLLRSGLLEEMKAGEAAHLPTFLDAWFSPATKERIRQILDSLGRG